MALSILPPAAIALFLVVLGSIWGSFAATLCIRWPKGESIIKGRSHCDHCGKPLAAHELLPLLSFLIQHGKCTGCARPISLFNTLTELACAGLGLLAALFFIDYAAFAAALLFWLLVPLILLDWKHLWLPDALMVVLAVAGLLLGGLVSNLSVGDRLTGGLVGYAALQAIRLGFRQLRGVEGMGGGDPKLLGAIALWTGWQGLPVIVMLASAIGLLQVLVQGKPKPGEDFRLPLGSFLAVATILFLIASHWPHLSTS